MPKYSNSPRKLSHDLAKGITSKLQTEKVKESIHEGFDPVMCSEDILALSF